MKEICRKKKEKKKKRNGNRYREQVSHFQQVVLENEIVKNYCYSGVLYRQAIKRSVVKKGDSWNKYWLLYMSTLNPRMETNTWGYFFLFCFSESSCVTGKWAGATLTNFSWKFYFRCMKKMVIQEKLLNLTKSRKCNHFS